MGRGGAGGNAQAPSPSGAPSAPGPAARFAAALEEFWIALFGWVPTPLGVALRTLAWRPLFAACGPVRFGTGLTLAGCRNMRFGKGVRVGRFSILTAQDGELTLAEQVSLSPGVHLGADNGRIEIGRCAAIGPGTVIRAANHRFSRRDVPIMHQGHVPGTVIIEEDVWIGANCVITPDVRIGRGAVVGAGAVVTHDVAPFSVVGGVPAKVIGRRGQEEG
ncbi:DapH/DapD/GlmU-related protein [uncultured Desulfovibrio sp.]|uniref:acyltransferase n=1 Tax=uncultured Desulfovibrio sp. TaxID=167968 RepID=UPI0025FB192B|nr:acyltransferase [uncultured Desulfovibrio sp.]